MITHPDQRRRVHRRTLAVIVVSQAFGGAGLAAGISVGALIAREMLDSDSLSGLPTALFTLGAALTAFFIGRVTQRTGRRTALSAGFLAGGVGAIGVIVATVLDAPALLFAALFVYGAGTATNLQARYAGTDLAEPHRRGTAVSIAMVATTLGAVAGPNLIGPLGGLAESVGLPPLTGPFLLAAAAYLLAGLILLALLRPDPYLLAQQLDAEQPTPVDDGQPSEVARRLVAVGALVMIVSQMVMVAIMTMTPVHMDSHGHSLSAVGLVIGLHIGAMWLPSLVTGLIVDKIGARVVAITSGLVLLAAGLLAAFAPGGGLVALVVALILLGLGWNLGLVAGTTMVVHGTAPATRAGTQGSIDVWVQITGALAGGASGLLMSAAGFGVLAIGGGIIALIMIPALFLTTREARPAAR